MDAPAESGKSTSGSQWLAAFMAAAAGLLRLFPHAWNFAPMGAIGIFAGARLRGWRGFALPISIAVLTDLILWARYPQYPPFQWFTYLSYLVCVLLGRLVAKDSNPLRIGGVALISSAVFFLVTNFGAWVQWTHIYTDRSITGVIQALVAGIPYYRGTLLGDLIYTPVLFGAYALLTRWLDRKAEARNPVEEPEREPA